MAKNLVDNFEKDLLLSLEIDDFIEIQAENFTNQTGRSEDDVAENFANDLLFDICFLLAKPRIKTKINN